MSSQQMSSWEPLAGIPARLYVEAIYDDYEGLRFLLRASEPNSRVLRLRFESVVGYRNINESYRYRTWAGVPTGMALPTLRTVKHSRWIDWLVAESGDRLDANELTHYAIHSLEDCIDIVTEFPPEVDWLG